MKKFITILIGILIIAAVGFALLRNKKEIDAQRSLALAKVEVRPVRAVVAGPLSETISYTYPGDLVAANELMLTASAQGQVSEVHVSKGKTVVKGELLASVENDLLLEQLEVARSAYEKLAKDMERFRVMLENDAITGQQFESLELNYLSAEAKYKAAQKQYSDSRIRSPINGVINQIFIKKGSMVGPGAPVCEIVNEESVLMRLKLSREETARLMEAEELSVIINGRDTVAAEPGFHSVKPDYAGMYETELILEGETDSGMPGMPALVRVVVKPSPEDIYIPQKALLGFGGAQLFVFCAENGKAVRKEIGVSGAVSGWVKVLDGLQRGDSVITDGNTIISDGDQIRIRP